MEVPATQPGADVCDDQRHGQNVPPVERPEMTAVAKLRMNSGQGMPARVAFATDQGECA
jgi:hypothetical protein